MRSRHPCSFLQANKQIGDWRKMFWIVTCNARAWLQTCITGLRAKEGHGWSQTIIFNISWLKPHMFSIFRLPSKGPSLPACAMSWGWEEQQDCRAGWAALAGTIWSILSSELPWGTDGELLKQLQVSSQQRTDKAR